MDRKGLPWLGIYMLAALPGALMTSRPTLKSKTLAGAFAAVVVDFVVYPVDTLKTRIQSKHYEQRFKDARTGAVKRNVLFRGLYQGVWSVIFSTIPSSGAFFTTYEAVKSTLLRTSTRYSNKTTAGSQGSTSGLRNGIHSIPTPIIHAIASSSAEAVSCLILTPAEVLKQNAQMISYDSASGSRPQGARKGKAPAMQVLSRFKSKPWKLWSGYSALLGRNLPTTGIQFPLFEYIRSRMIGWRRRRKAELGIQRVGVGEVLVERAGLTGLSAGIAGIVSSLATTPIDVVKTRMMLSASETVSATRTDDESKRGPRRKGTVQFGKDIFHAEGVRGLFKGGAIRAGWTAVSVGLYLGLYEGGRLFLENRRMEESGREKRGRKGDELI